MSWEELLEQIDAYSTPIEFWEKVTEILETRIDQIMASEKEKQWWGSLA
jgi:hypothetical protein